MIDAGLDTEVFPERDAHRRGKRHDRLDFGIGKPVNRLLGFVFFAQGARRAHERTLSALHARGAVGPALGAGDPYAAHRADVVNR